MAKPFPWRGILQALAITAGLFLILVFGGIVALSNGPGRWLVNAFVDGRDIDHIGRVRVEGVHGDLLSDFSIDRITLSDASGVWLEAESIAVNWRPRSLANGPIRISLVSVERVTIARTPDLPDDANTPQGGGNLPDLILTEARIDRLELAEGIAGPAASLQAHGNLRLQTGAPGQAAISITRLDAPGDAIDGQFDILADGGITGHFTASGAPGGTLATLVQMPDEQIEVAAEISGNTASGTGHFSVQLTGRDLASGQLSWADNRWQIDSAVEPGNWTGLPETVAPILSHGEVSANGAIRAFSVQSARLHADTLDVELSRNAAQNWNLTLQTRGQALAQLSGGEVSAGALNFQGRLDGSEGYGLDGQLDIDQLAAGETRIGAVAGPVQLNYNSGQLVIAAQLTLSDPELGESVLNELLGERASLTLDLTADLEQDRYQLTSSQLVGAHVSIDADGIFAPGSDELALNARAALDDIARLTDHASGPVTAVITTTGANEIALEIDGSAIDTDARLAPLIEALRVTATLRLEDGGWRVPALSVRSTQLSLEAQAQGSSGSDWQASGDLAFSGTLEGVALSFAGGLATGFELTSTDGLITAHTVTATEAILVGDTRFNVPRLALNAEYDDGNLSADWTLAGRYETRELVLAGAAEQHGANWTVAVRDSQFGPSVIQADARIEQDRLHFSLLAGTQARWSLTLDYDAALDALLDGEFDARLGARDVVSGSVIVSDAQVSLSGPMSGLALDAELSGLAGVPFDLNATGTIGWTETGLRAELSPAGHLGANAWQTVEPILAVIEGANRALGGRITFGGGELGAHWQESLDQAQLDVQIERLPVDLLVDLAGLPEVDGMINGNAALQQTGGIWRGSAELVASGLTAASLSDAPDLQIENRLTLGDDAQIETLATGGGLSARAFLTRSGVTSDLLAVLNGPEAVIAGGIEASGEIQSLTSLLLPIGTSLAGGADIDLAISGTRGAPEIDGPVALHDGRFSAADTGTDIVDIQMLAHLHNSQVELESFTAGDGSTGEMHATAAGVITAQGPRGQAEFNFENFTAARRPDLTARVTGQTRLTMDENGLLVAGETRLDRVYALPPANGTAAIPEIEVIELNLPKNQIRASRPRLPIRLDYRVYATDQIYFNSSNFNTEWRADIRITGQAKKPTLTGTADLVRGSATVFGRRFTLQQGGVLFNGPPTAARLSLLAHYEREGFQADVTIAGPLMSPSVTLTSVPTLPDDEIIARLLFDRSASELGPFEAAQLAAQLSGQDMFGFIDRFRGLVGVDRLDIGANADGSLTVTSGRRFGNDFYVEVESAGAAALSTARVEWTLTPQLSILSRLSGDTTASVSIRWRRDY
ncbi:translocation/assembly module TamB domain-containing protein [uncultured Maricaulis sp.]|uniref:translocation/assembly module TamB domain-containing protein n=1 Tax=uncultured Maricaulis sp. TaxID=174710 RepID=UPI0030D7F7A0|tara:strand:- start:60621 stop:64676 length:4056 start_codon:yes stop_codon:yes gene_type:complete